MEENKDISQIALERIKESGIKPISKKVFNLKRVLFWSLVGFAVLVGSVSFSITVSILFNNDWYLYNKFGFGYILKSLPYFWLVCLILFSLLGEFYYRKTFLGYRHRMVTIVGIYIILTVVFGVILQLFGLGETIEKTVSQNIPIYHVVVFDLDEFWLQPKVGLLSGKIVSIENGDIKIIDSGNIIWTIKTENASVGNATKIQIGESIKIVGGQDDDGVFRADQIYPINNSFSQSCCSVR